jgi:Tfp pilus assembly protein PilF
MSSEEDARRKKLEADIRRTKSLIAKNVWHSAGGIEFNDHYKVLERAYERGGVEGVEELVRQAVERYETTVPRGKTIPEYLGLARQYKGEGKATEAKEVLHHLMQQDNRNPEVFNQIAQLEWDIGIRDEAVNTMKRAVKLAPGRAEYLSNLGQMLSRLNRVDEAEPVLRATVDLLPNNWELVSNLGIVLAQRGKIAEGLERCRAAAAAAPQSAVVRYRLGLLLANQGQADDARAAFEAALAADPSFAPARQSLADLKAGRESAGGQPGIQPS